MEVAGRKGIRSRLRNRLWGVGGDGSEPGDAGACSGERFLFCMTTFVVHGSRLTGEVECLWAERLLWRLSGRHVTDRENLGEQGLPLQLVVLITAAGPQGE